ncbi:electron transport complex subunit RsxB [Extensimonas sp. H3M7-6]|uniref:electron transport complex subunit RsxB n=1 Tax=Extensimonas soli TaxID=3031322 RepID=UPI0023DB15E9|nr:electron transport complex subunit RsxB [Extensimonas sp. H3M7-6]MDF1480822.1 electron transport complex subunit RsxB [Extensimonas sp. H3M7-6]
MDTAAAEAAQRIAALLPQTQCTRCGYPDCAAYAQAIAVGEAAINRCPPGGAEGVVRLAAATGQPVLPLDPECGQETARSVVFIDESACIGCTLCLKVCPTDAIVGTNKRMHTVIEAHCTGCELCLPACPVDCMHLENASGTATGWAAWSPAQADAARARYARRQRRLVQETASSAPPTRPTSPAASTPGHPTADSAQADASSAPSPTQLRQAAIAAALERARQRRVGS